VLLGPSPGGDAGPSSWAARPPAGFDFLLSFSSVSSCPVLDVASMSLFLPLTSPEEIVGGAADEARESPLWIVGGAADATSV